VIQPDRKKSVMNMSFRRVRMNILIAKYELSLIMPSL